jgi:phosphoglycolate phosphatase
MRLLIFDLDGTLIDSKSDLAHAVNATRAHLGMPPLEHDTVSSYVGNGAPVLIRRALGPEAPDALVETALEYFLKYYREHALDHTVLYPGVRESLARLLAAGRLLAVLTNKPTEVSRAIMAGLGVGEWFFRIYGGNSFEFKKPHPAGVEALLRESGVMPAQAMMVGDSSVDIRTARNGGIRACGVTWGLQPETLADPAPDLLVDRMEQLADWVLGNGEQS